MKQHQKNEYETNQTIISLRSIGQVAELQALLLDGSGQVCFDATATEGVYQIGIESKATRLTIHSNATWAVYESYSCASSAHWHTHQRLRSTKSRWRFSSAS